MFKKFWEKIDGWKTVIGVGIRFGAMLTHAFFPQVLTPDQYDVLILVGDAISGVGIGDKARKWVVAKKK